MKLEPLMMDGFQLADENYKTGVVFLLNKDVNLLNDKFYNKKIKCWNIIIKDKSKLLIIKTKRKIKHDHLVDLAYKIAQEFLDLICLEINHFNSIKNYKNHVCWYLDNTRRILDISFKDTLKIMTTMQIKIKSTDKRKKVKVLGNIIDYHPALRYFRQARTNTDYINSFRNQYLAFEQLLSSLYCIKKKEGEWVWTQNGIRASTKKKDIAKILNCNINDITTEFKTQIYNTRLALSHAKKGKEYFLPEDLVVKKNIINSLQTLESINRVLFNEYYKTTISVGGMADNGLQQIITSFSTKEKQFKILISNKIDVLKPDSKLNEELINPNSITDAKFEITDCSTRIFADFKMELVLSKFSELSRIGLIGCEGLYGVNQLEVPIHLTNIIDIIRINEYISVISEDFHQFFD